MRNAARVWLTAVLLSVTQAAYPQTITGTMTGLVKDASGGVLPGATVTMTHLQTGRMATVVTDAEGRYEFTTIKPGAYPWRNHPNAWRPAHIHFSLFGTSFQTRLVTQMYFPGDPLFPFDPIFNSVTDERDRARRRHRRH